MRVESNEGKKTFFAYEAMQKEEKDKKNSNIFAGDLEQGKLKSPLERKVEKAKKEAMKVVKAQFENDAKIDDDLETRREKIAALKEEADTYNAAINDMKQTKAGLKEQFGISQDSKEHQDLLLIEKANQAKKEGRLDKLSKEELNRIAEMGPLTDYQTAALSYDEVIDYYEGLKQDALDGIAVESAIIKGTKQALLKNKGMIQAQKTAETMEQSASGEIIGMLMEEAKEQMDEEMEELKEEAKKAVEKKEEEEKLLQKKKGDEDVSEDLMYEMQEADQQMDQIQSELQEIVEKNKLLNEDLKGIAVNETV
ncbi:MAG: hypothetical protein GX234_12325 [Clostridiales bacterium]|nr:hypothetical protein [Clostridiales bacterium]